MALIDRHVSVEGNAPPAYRSIAGFSDARKGIPSERGGLFAARVAPDSVAVGVNVTPTVGPTDEAQRDFYFGDLWFNRFHITPNYLDLGNVVGDQLFTLTVWSAFRTEKTLLGINADNTDGVNLTGDMSSGTLAPYQELRYQLEILTDGPPVIDASFTWDFDEEVAPDPRIVMEGRRLLLWPFMPQWPIDETFEWRTEVLRTYSKVSRTGLLPTPRKRMEISFQLTPEQQTEAQRLARTWGYRPFGLPDFTQFQEIGAVAAGATVLPCDSGIMDIEAEGLLVIYEDWDKTEIVQVETVDGAGGVLNLKKPTVGAYTDAAIAPLYSGAARGGLRFEQTAFGVAVASGEFLQDYSNDLSEAETADHHGFPLIPFRPEVDGSRLSEGSRWNVHILDSGIGLPRVRPKEEAPVYTTEISYSAQDPLELMLLKQWLHNRAGRRRAFCLPSYQEDYQLAGAIAQNTNALTLVGPAYGQEYTTGALQMELIDGSIYDLTVDAISVNGDQTGVSVAQSFDRQIEPADVARISLVRKVVFSSDTIKLKHSVNGRKFKAKVEEVPWLTS